MRAADEQSGPQENEFPTATASEEPVNQKIQSMPETYQAWPNPRVIIAL